MQGNGNFFFKAKKASLRATLEDGGPAFDAEFHLKLPVFFLQLPDILAQCSGMLTVQVLHGMFVLSPTLLEGPLGLAVVCHGGLVCLYHICLIDYFTGLTSTSNSSHRTDPAFLAVTRLISLVGFGKDFFVVGLDNGMHVPHC